MLWRGLPGSADRTRRSPAGRCRTQGPVERARLRSGVASRPEPEGEVVIGGTRGGEDSDVRLLQELRTRRRKDAYDVDVAVQDRGDGICDVVAQDEPIDAREMRPPVAGIPDQRELLARVRSSRRGRGRSRSDCPSSDRRCGRPRSWTGPRPGVRAGEGRSGRASASPRTARGA